MSTRREALALGAGAAVVAVAASPAPAVAAPRHDPPSWVGTWAAVPTTVPPRPPTVLDDQTVRHVVHISAGGDELRIRLTNEFGSSPLRIGEVRVGLRAGSAASTDMVRGNGRRVRPEYDSGDHLHPNDTGMAAMAAAVPLRLFR
jgi:hypothetical protein